MTKTQTKLIKLAYKVDADGAKWRRRMNAWLDSKEPKKMTTKYWATFLADCETRYGSAITTTYCYE